MADDDLSRLRIDKSQVPFRRGKRKRLAVIVLVASCFVVLGSLFHKGVLTPAVDVQVATVQSLYPSQTFTLLNASGYVVAQRKAAVAAKITGRLVYLAVEEGSAVKEGDVIARLENDDTVAARERAQANVEAARYNLKQAEIELEDAIRAYERKKQVVGKGYLSQLDFDTADARYRKAEAAVVAQRAALQASEAALREASINVEYASIRAPFDAVVLTKNADIGDIVTPIGAAANAKAAVVTIADLDSLQVEADVSESHIEQVKVGQPCEIQLDALPDTRFPGVVHMIVPTADRSKASVMVKVAFVQKNSRILPEMSAKVAFLSREISPEEEEPIRAVPASAVVNRQGEDFVYVVKRDRTMETRVYTGRRFDSIVQILDGVNAGDRVVLNPDRVSNGSKINVSEQ